MRTLDEDTITQAVIARNAAAGDARLREIMTSLVQHLHGFAREVRLSCDEWRAALDFLDEVARGGGVAPLSDMLGLSTLVVAQSHRRPAGCTEASEAAQPSVAAGAPQLVCELHGRVLGLDGEAVHGAEVRVGDADPQRSDRSGRFVARARLADAPRLLRDEPEGAAPTLARLLLQLRRHANRPAHLPVRIRAEGYASLATQLFRRGDPFLDSDAAFGVRRSLISDWHRNDSQGEAVYSVSFDFVLPRLSA